MITGASGFIGYAVVEELIRLGKYKVVAVISGRREVTFPENVKVEIANLLEEDQIKRVISDNKPDIICHFAWALEKKGFLDSDKNIEWLEASISILKTFCELGGKHFFFAGSSSEYGKGTRGNSEEEIGAEFTLYGTVKRAFEETMLCYCHNKGIIATAARFFSVYGPRDDRGGSAIPTAIQDFMDGKKVICKSPYNIWDYVYIDDAARATVRLIDKSANGIFNIASGKPVMMFQVFNCIAQRMGCTDLLEMNHANNQSISLLADTKKTESAIDYVCDTSLEAGISYTVDWWKNR